MNVSSTCCPPSSPQLTRPFLSQIRYQGILHSIDPVEATVSLEKGEWWSWIQLERGAGARASRRGRAAGGRGGVDRENGRWLGQLFL